MGTYSHLLPNVKDEAPVAIDNALCPSALPHHSARRVNSKLALGHARS
jgi:hypothetical protein